jgi:CRP-like cAMP-binding protein
VKKIGIKEHSLRALRKELEAYCSISDETWRKLSQICVLINLKKKQFLIKAGQIPQSFGFVYSGLLRAYITNQNGNEYNKIFFSENTFPGAMVALLTTSASTFTIEALEESCLLQINFSKYRHLLKICDDLKWFQILYLEKNWVIEKEKREVALVQNNATERYMHFKENYAALEDRIPQFHIASHLGVTPTQLSRIRKILPNPEKF